MKIWLMMCVSAIVNQSGIQEEVANRALRAFLNNLFSKFARTVRNTVSSVVRQPVV